MDWKFWTGEWLNEINNLGILSYTAILFLIDDFKNRFSHFSLKKNICMATSDHLFANNGINQFKQSFIWKDARERRKRTSAILWLVKLRYKISKEQGFLLKVTRIEKEILVP